MLHNLKRVATNGTKNESNKKIRKFRSMIEILNSPIKSQSDKKEYRLIKLPNGLTSLLVQHFIDNEGQTDDEDHQEKVSESDSKHSQESIESCPKDDSGDEEEDEEPKEKMAAVALCIKVGSWFDPSHIQGLSHFLEHMIFMGSEKYPKENEFDQFITNNGGVDNAMTECEYTMFYFEIVEEHLAGAINRFAQLFVAPLMLRDSMGREMEAVESEFQNNITDDDSRVMQLFASTANGPASSFTWGNLKTLKEGISSDELYSAVHEFRRKHYVANRMTLCVESSQTLSDLQKMVESNFSEIKSGPEPASLASTAPAKPFKPDFFQKVFYVKPKADNNKLYMTFVLPSMEKYYKSKPQDYLAYIIQHEGVGSLNSYLKQKLLAMRVEAGADDQGFEGNSMFTLFSIDVILTEEGLKNVEVVLEAIFSFLLLLKTTPIEDHEKAFNELKQIKDTSFKYREEKTSGDNVEEMAVNMMYYDHQDILTGPDLFFEFDKKLVQDLIDQLNEKNFNLLILSEKHDKFEKKEKWFGTEYDEVDFPETFTDLWNNRKLNPEFSIPPPNEFLCSKFEIQAQNLDASILPHFPGKVFENDTCECFYKLDGTFKLPHALINVYLVSPKTVSSVRQMTLTSLYSMVTKHYMTEKLYPAVCAGLGYQMYSEEKGMLIKMSGYDEKLPLLLDIITKDLKTISGRMDTNVFETYRKQFKKHCYNNLISSKFLNKDSRLNIVEEHHKFFYERYIEADAVSFEELVEFANEFLKHLKIQILVQGNIGVSATVAMAETVIKNLNCGGVAEKIESRSYKLPIGSHVVFIKSMLPNDKNSTTTNYIQLGPSSIRLQCLIEFVEKILEEPLFDILRTQEQFGYSVSASHRCNHGILGFSITVQSQEYKKSTTVVDKRIEKFLHEDMVKIFDKMSDEEFDTVQSALIKLKKMVEVELESEVNRHWCEITCREYIFNRLDLEANMIGQLTKQDVVDFYKTKVIAGDARKLSIHVIGTGTGDEILAGDNHVPQLELMTDRSVDGKKVITDMEAFKKTLELYPVTKTTIDL